MGKYHKHLAGFVGVILFMLGAISAKAHDIDDAQEKDISQIHGKPIVIEITEDGFFPREISIQQGETVMWRNIGRRSHWPASDFHPMHTSYPEKSEDDCLGSSFDACRALRPNDTWEFTFNITGAWRYHDHLFPAMRGIIHVYLNERDDHTQEVHSGNSTFFKHSIRNFLDFLKKFFSPTIELFVKLKEYFVFEPKSQVPDPEKFWILTWEEQEKIITKTSNFSPKEAWKYLKKTAVRDGEVVINAHQFAHLIGNIAYQKNGIEGVAICDSTFAFGCYHGVTEEFLKQKGPRSIPGVARECRRIFSKESKHSINYTGCIHGMGHGLLTWEGLDLKKTLQDCDMLEKEDRPYCYDGAFMEYSFSMPKQDMIADNPWLLCTSLNKQYHANCARYLPNLLRSVLHLNPSEVADTCLQASTRMLKDRCVDNIGFFVGQGSRGDIKKVIEHCDVVSDQEYKYRCITAAAGELIFQEYKGWRENALFLCEILPKEWEEKCLKRNQDIIEQYNREM